MIVLGTNVVSEPLKPTPDAALLRWLARQAPETLFITAITKAELLTGFEKMPLGNRRDAIGTALNSQVLPLFEGRILAFGSDCAKPFSRLVASAKRAGNSISFADAVIAAIALANGYAVATRNVDDFVATGVEIVNPWLD